VRRGGPASYRGSPTQRHERPPPLQRSPGRGRGAGRSKFPFAELGALTTSEPLTTAVLQNSMVSTASATHPSWNELSPARAASTGLTTANSSHDNPGLVAFSSRSPPFEGSASCRFSSVRRGRKDGGQGISPVCGDPLGVRLEPRPLSVAELVGVGAALQEELRK